MKWNDNHADVYTANIQRLETSELMREMSKHQTNVPRLNMAPYAA
jgi:hypothetical protein